MRNVKNWAVYKKNEGYKKVVFDVKINPIAINVEILRKKFLVL